MQRKALLAIIAALMFIIPASAQTTLSDAVGQRPVFMLVVDDFGSSQATQDYADALINADESLLPTQAVENGNVQTYSDLQSYTDFQTFETQLQNDLASALPSSPSTQNCAMNSDSTSWISTQGTSWISTQGTSWISTQGTGNWLKNGLSHGDRVYGAANDAISAVTTQQPVNMIKVDTNGFDTGTIQTQIDNNIANITATYPSAIIVVNMSYSIVPCDYVVQTATYNQLLQTMGSSKIGSLQGLFTDINTNSQANLNPDPLQSYIADQCADTNEGDSEEDNEEDGEEEEDGEGDGDSSTSTTLDDIGCTWSPTGGAATASNPPIVVFVAASGNGPSKFSGTRTNYPYAPAEWANVISVSASNYESVLSNDGAAPAVYANYGTQMMPGTRTFTFNGNTYEDNGTSFAAPRYSAMLALAFAGATGFTNADANCAADPMTLLESIPQPDDWVTSPPTTYDVSVCATTSGTTSTSSTTLNGDTGGTLVKPATTIKPDNGTQPDTGSSNATNTSSDTANPGGIPEIPGF